MVYFSRDRPHTFGIYRQRTVNSPTPKKAMVCFPMHTQRPSKFVPNCILKVIIRCSSTICCNKSNSLWYNTGWNVTLPRFSLLQKTWPGMVCQSAPWLCQLSKLVVQWHKMTDQTNVSVPSCRASYTVSDSSQCCASLRAYPPGYGCLAEVTIHRDFT